MKKMNAITVFCFSSVDPMSAFIHLWSVERPAVATVRFPCNWTCARVCVLVSDALTNLIGSHIHVSRLSSKSRTATKRMTFFFLSFFLFLGSAPSVYFPTHFTNQKSSVFLAIWLAR